MTAAPDDVWEALLGSRDRAMRVARARCADPHEAEDCVQEALVRIAAMPNVDISRIGPLVSTVVARLAVDGHRARGRSTRLAGKLRSLDRAAPSPEEDVCDFAEARWLWSLRESLSDQDRRALELRIAGRSVTESAEDLGVTYKAAENSLRRARSRLRTAWAATAALIGVLWVRRPAIPATALAAAPVAFLAAATLAVLSPAQAPTPAAPVNGPTIIASLDDRPAPVSLFPLQGAAAPSPGPGRGDGTPPPPVAQTEAPVESASHTRRAEITPAVEVAEHRVAGPVTAEDHETGRTFVEEVQHCAERAPERLEQGVIGCPP